MERIINNAEAEYPSHPYYVSEAISEDIKKMTDDELEKAIFEEEARIQQNKRK